MKSEDFFVLLIFELQNQDLFNFNEIFDMINQVLQICSIEILDDLIKMFSQMIDQQWSLGMVDLIGKFVEGEVVDVEGNVIMLSGVVMGVNFDLNGNVMFEFDSGQQLFVIVLKMIMLVDSNVVVIMLLFVMMLVVVDVDKIDIVVKVVNEWLLWFMWNSSIQF